MLHDTLLSSTMISNVGTNEIIIQAHIHTSSELTKTTQLKAARQSQCLKTTLDSQVIVYVTANIRNPLLCIITRHFRNYA